MNKPQSDSAEGLVGAVHLLRQGFVFVRLDQAEVHALNLPAGAPQP